MNTPWELATGIESDHSKRLELICTELFAACEAAKNPLNWHGGKVLPKWLVNQLEEAIAHAKELGL